MELSELLECLDLTGNFDIGLTDEFATDSSHLVMWHSSLIGYERDITSLSDLLEKLQAKWEPVLGQASVVAGAIRFDV